MRENDHTLVSDGTLQLLPRGGGGGSFRKLTSCLSHSLFIFGACLLVALTGDVEKELPDLGQLPQMTRGEHASYEGRLSKPGERGELQAPAPPDSLRRPQGRCHRAVQVRITTLKVKLKADDVPLSQAIATSRVIPAFSP